MRWIYFLSRVTFLCNLIYLLALYMRVNPSFPEVFMTSTIIIIGTVMAFVGTIIVNLVYLWMLVTRVNFSKHLPVWLAIANFLFLLLQVILYFIQ